MTDIGVRIADASHPLGPYDPADGTDRARHTQENDEGRPDKAPFAHIT
jgi:hypothetical protein